MADIFHRPQGAQGVLQGASTRVNHSESYGGQLGKHSKFQGKGAAHFALGFRKAKTNKPPAFKPHMPQPSNIFSEQHYNFEDTSQNELNMTSQHLMVPQRGRAHLFNSQTIKMRDNSKGH